jgi:hypothetical protein
MTNRDTVDYLLGRFSASIGIEPLALNAAGACSFSYRENALITLEVPDSSSEVYLVGTVMPLPVIDPPSLNAFYARVLRINAFDPVARGASLALDPERDQLLLCHQHPIAALDEVSFQNLLTNFVQAVAAISALLTEGASDTSPGSRDYALRAHLFSQRA